jgi:hypothetical protein
MLRWGLVAAFAVGQAKAADADVVQQVRLMDALGAAVSGQHSVVVSVVDDADPALPEGVCYNSDLGTIDFVDGFASLALDGVPASCFAEAAWVAVQIGGVELLPRTRVHDSPRAAIARQVPTAASPSSCDASGELVFDTDGETLLVCSGTAWQAVSAGSTVGDVRESLLTQTQFQAVNGPGWVLMDGRDISGSALATLTGLTSLPDARGVALRGKHHGRSDGGGNPDGDLAIGFSQADALGSHGHSVVSNPHTGGSGGYDQPAAFNQGYPTNGLGPQSWVANSVQNRAIPYGRLYASDVGDAETRMRNITVNIFVRIN